MCANTQYTLYKSFTTNLHYSERRKKALMNKTGRLRMNIGILMFQIR